MVDREYFQGLHYTLVYITCTILAVNIKGNLCGLYG